MESIGKILNEGEVLTSIHSFLLSKSGKAIFIDVHEIMWPIVPDKPKFMAESRASGASGRFKCYATGATIEEALQNCLTEIKKQQPAW